MDLQLLSPNRVALFFVGALVFYWVLSLFVPWMILRDIFNALAFGAQTMVVLTWAPAAWKAIKENASSGTWLLILAIFFTCTLAMIQRIYAIIYNSAGRPDAWAESAISGFWPYGFMITSALFMISPSFTSDGIRSQGWWILLAAGILGGIPAGVLLTLSIQSF